MSSDARVEAGPLQKGVEPLAAPARPLLERVADGVRQCTPLRDRVLRTRTWRNRMIDRWLRISTPYPVPERFRLDTRFQDAVPTEPVDYLLLRKFMREVHTGPEDVVFEIGCGMGRALCLFARRKVRTCVGIEFDPALAEIARRNAGRLRGRRSEVEVRCQDAVEADYRGGTVFWLFNPFGRQTLESVLDRIEQTLREEPRQIQVGYVNPVHSEALNARPWLRCVKTVHSMWFGTYGASFWRGEGVRVS